MGQSAHLVAVGVAQTVDVVGRGLGVLQRQVLAVVDDQDQALGGRSLPSGYTVPGSLTPTGRALLERSPVWLDLVLLRTLALDEKPIASPANPYR